MGPFARAALIASALSVVPIAASAQSRAPDPGAAAQREDARARPSRGADAAACDALMPGFEAKPDGSTRLFVELSRAVPFEAKAGPSSVTYVLKGAHVARRNNQNPLVTVNFNTPVTSARLTPHGRDLWFVVDLRGGVQPTASMDVDKAGGAVLSLEFPKGDYLAPTSDAALAAAPPSAASAPKTAESAVASRRRP